MKIALICAGRRFDICEVVFGNRHRVTEFIDSLEETDQKKIVALLSYTAENGTSSNPEKFRKLEGGIWEFKSRQVRILCFFDKGRVIITTHGFVKKRGKTPRGEIEKARKLKDAYFGERGRG